MNSVYLAITVILLGAGIVMASDGTQDKDVAETIISMEKAALQRWINGDPWGFIEIFAPEITYHEPEIELRIDGFEAMKDFLAAFEGQIYADSFELLNPRVQLHGDVAVLSFNFVEYTESEGNKSESRWNATEVYLKTAEGWRIIHSHWSYTMPVIQRGS